MIAIYAISNNGYMARGPNDDMSWTSSLDKKIFNLLTTAFGDCVSSKTSYHLLPQKMRDDPMRNIYIAERTGKKSLVELNRRNPKIVLIGGPTILKAAYDLNILHTIIVTKVKIDIMGDPKYKDPLADVLKNQNPKRIDFGDIVVSIYKMQYGPQK